MKIKMSPKHFAVGPHCTFHPGQEYNVGDDVGAPIVAGGYAVDITRPTRAETHAKKTAEGFSTAEEVRAAEEPKKTPAKKLKGGRRRG